MSYSSRGETDGSLLPRQISAGKRKPSVIGKAFHLARFRPLSRAYPGPIPARVGVEHSNQPNPLAASDLKLALQAPPQDIPVLVFLGSFLVYYLTTAPTLFGWDSGEYAATAYKLGVPHATGYPLYILLGKLFTYIPFGDVAYRLNLMSAVFASGTITVVYLISLFITRRIMISIAAAGCLAFSYFFWSSAVITEVYSLHALLNALTIYLLLRWNRDGGDRLLYAGVFIWGLSFGNHMTTALLGPAIVYLIGMGLWDRRISWQHLPPLAACFLVTLAVYLYLPLRYLAEAVPYVMSHYTAEGVLVRTNTTTIEGMWQVLTARQFADFFGVHRGPAYIDQLKQLVFWSYANFLGVGLALGVLGIVRNFLVDKRRLVFFGLIFAANALFFASYAALDKYFMFVTGYLIWSLWIGEGLYLIVSSVKNSLSDGWQERVKSAVGPWVGRVRWEAFSLLLPAVMLWVNFSYADVSSFTHVRDTYPKIMRSFEPNALVLAWWADVTPMQYYQQVENLRPDIQLVDRWLISPENEIKLINNSLPNRPVYVFEGHVREVPHPKYEVPFLQGTFDTGYRIIPP